MKKLFSKNNLILRAVLSLFLLSALLLFLSFFYNQNRNVLASEGNDQNNNGLLTPEQEIDYGQLKCGREIPVGEAMEKTMELLENLIQELDSIYANAYYQIRTAEEMIGTEEMIGLAEKCDVEECIPQGCGVDTRETDCLPCFDDDGELIESNEEECKAWSTCDEEYCLDPEPCESDWLCHGEYRACPQCKIEEKFAGGVEPAYNNIENSEKEIGALIDGLYKGIDRREPLCAKENEDIRDVACSQYCLANPIAGGCPKIKIIEVIKRKLYLSRGEFDKCYISADDWGKIERGEMVGKWLFNCLNVLREDYPRYTKTIEKIDGKEVPVCTSLQNWFCCH